MTIIGIFQTANFWLFLGGHGIEQLLNIWHTKKTKIVFFETFNFCPKIFFSKKSIQQVLIEFMETQIKKNEIFNF